MTDLLLWDDNPSDVDLLGFVDVAAPVLEAIRRDDLDPTILGPPSPSATASTPKSSKNDSDTPTFPPRSTPIPMSPKGCKPKPPKRSPA